MSTVDRRPTSGDTTRNRPRFRRGRHTDGASPNRTFAVTPLTMISNVKRRCPLSEYRRLVRRAGRRSRSGRDSTNLRKGGRRHRTGRYRRNIHPPRSDSFAFPINREFYRYKAGRIARTVDNRGDSGRFQHTRGPYSMVRRHPATCTRHRSVRGN